MSDAASKVESASPPGNIAREAVMFVVVLAQLAIVGLILPHGDSGEEFRESLAGDPTLPKWLIALWIVTAAEALLGFMQSTDKPRAWKRLLLVLLLPPLRLAVSPRYPNDWIWVPFCGWQRVDEASFAKLELRLALPMIILTLLIVPVLLIEFVGQKWLEASPVLAFGTHALTALIWLGFAVEFILMVSACPHKVRYCIKHWINLVIILLPLVAFLRFLRLLRFAKLARAYRLRSVTMRAWKLITLFNLLDRVHQRSPQKYIAGLEKKIAEMEAEVAALKAKLAEFRGKNGECTAEVAAGSDHRADRVG